LKPENCCSTFSGIYFIAEFLSGGIVFYFFQSDETKLIAENEEIGFEQLREMPSEAVEKIQNNTTKEEFSNKINSGEG